MKENGFLAVTLSLAGWVLVIVSAMQLLSGTFDTRSCQTGCVSIIFWLSVAAGVAGLLLGLMSLFANFHNTYARISVILGLPLCAIFAGLILIGQFA